MEWKSSVRILNKDNGSVVKEFESIAKLVEFMQENGYAKGNPSTTKHTILSVLNGRAKKDGKGNFYIPKTAYGFGIEYINRAKQENNKEMEFIKSIGKVKEYQNFLNKKEN